MAAEFEIFRGSDNQYRWHFQAANGEIVAQSEGYTTKQSCQNGIESLKDDAPDAAVRDTTVDSG